MTDGYVALIERTRQEHAEYMRRAHPPAVGKLRESGLVDLSDAGVPMVAGYTPSAPSGEAFIEPTGAEILDGLRDAGVPLRPSFGERVTRGAGGFGRMRLSAAARDTVRALAAKADEAATRVPATADALDEPGNGELIDLGADVPSTVARPNSEAMQESRTPGDGELIDLGLREAALPTYGGGESGTPEVEYDDGSAYRLVTELYSVISNENDDKGENLENGQITAIADSVLSGHPLSSVQYGILKRLAAKYAEELSALRASDDDSQNYLNVPDPATGRLAAVARGSDTADAAAGRVAA